MFTSEGDNITATVEFTENQMFAIAMLANHVEGRFELSDDDLQMALLATTRLWHNMNAPIRSAKNKVGA